MLPGMISPIVSRKGCVLPGCFIPHLQWKAARAGGPEGLPSGPGGTSNGYGHVRALLDRDRLDLLLVIRIEAEEAVAVADVRLGGELERQRAGAGDGQRGHRNRGGLRDRGDSGVIGLIEKGDRGLESLDVFQLSPGRWGEAWREGLAP